MAVAKPRSLALANDEHGAPHRKTTQRRRFRCRHINPRFTKPLDEGTTSFSERAADVVVTMEDHFLPGELWQQRAGSIQRKTNPRRPVVRIGWPDKFIEHASTVEYLRRRHV